MSLCKGFPHLVYLESLEALVYGNLCDIRESLSVHTYFGLDQVQIHFIGENDRSASLLVISSVQAMTRRRRISQLGNRKH